MADEVKHPEYRVFLNSGHGGKVHILFSGRPSEVAAGIESAMRTSVPYKLAVVMAVSDLLEQSHPALSDDLANLVKEMIPELEAISQNNNYVSDN